MYTKHHQNNPELNGIAIFNQVIILRQYKIINEPNRIKYKI